MRVVIEALRYFSQHSGNPIVMAEMARSLGISEADLHGSFDAIRGMTAAEALLEHRLNRLFQALTDQPRQGLRQAIQACGLAQTSHVVQRFERAFGITMPLFLLTCRRADEDRRFRRQHPEAEALVLNP